MKSSNQVIDVSESLKLDFITESENEKSRVDGVNILAHVVGPAFFPDRVSGNNVHYPRSLWNSVLNEEKIQKLLRDNIMFGTIGHEIVHLTDEELRQGIPSHITTKMWIDEETGIGMAEHLILNTDAGRTLNTVLRAGSKIKVSTRALGSLSKPDPKTGIQEVENFEFQRIDFVIFPGFDEASPEIKESLNKDGVTDNSTDNLINNEENNMSEQTIEILQKQIEEKNAQIAELQSKLDATQTTKGEVSESLATYKALGTAKEISESLNAYKALGTVKQINESMDKAEDAIQKLKEERDAALGKVKEVEEERDQLIADAAKSLTEEDETISQLREYQELGTVEELKELADVSESLIKEKQVSVIESLSRKFKVSKAIVEALLNDERSAEEVEDLLNENSQVTETDYTKDPDYIPSNNEYNTQISEGKMISELMEEATEANPSEFGFDEVVAAIKETSHSSNIEKYLGITLSKVKLLVPDEESFNLHNWKGAVLVEKQVKVPGMLLGDFYKGKINGRPAIGFQWSANESAIFIAPNTIKESLRTPSNLYSHGKVRKTIGEALGAANVSRVANLLRRKAQIQ